MTTRNRAAVALLLFIGAPNASVAQQSGRLYAGGTFTGYTQTRSDNPPLGGTTWAGSFFVGGRVSRRLAIEFEPTFGRMLSWEYDYRPGPSRPAHVVASRRDTFWAGQLRARAGAAEPVFGLAYTHADLQRHATSFGQPYFDDSRKERGLAAVLGLDVPLDVARHFALLPTFRLLLNFGPASESSGFSDPLGAQTRAGATVLRYGVGGRVTF